MEKHGTAIEWTHGEGFRGETWNPIHGCSKVSPGCAHCYAETLSRRFNQTPLPWTPANAERNVLLKPHKLREPLGWREPRMVFVNSMSDLFHELVPDGYIAKVFAVMSLADRHVFQVLTKRPERMRDLLGQLRFRARVLQERALLGAEDSSFGASLFPLPNVWLGTSIENRRFVGRADVLRETPAAVRFISAEPLLGPLVPDRTFRGADGSQEPGWSGPHLGEFDGPGLDLRDIDWLIVGGESGAHHRRMDPRWARDLRDACHATRPECDCLIPYLEGVGQHSPGCAVFRPGGTAFFFKQWGGHTSKAGGRELDGRTWDEMPSVRAVR